MLHCPECGGTVFKGTIIRGAIFDISKGQEAGATEGFPALDFTIKALSKGVAFEVGECKNCGHKFENGNEDLVDTVKCGKCSKEFNEQDTIQGLCMDCFMEAHPELKNLTTIQLLRKIAELQEAGKNANPEKTASKVEAKSDKVDKTEDDATAKPKRSRKKTEETPKEETPKKETVEESKKETVIQPQEEVKPDVVPAAVDKEPKKEEASTPPPQVDEDDIALKIIPSQFDDEDAPF